MQVLVVAVQNSVPHSQLGTATATATFFRTIGGAFGVAILGAVFNAQLLAVPFALVAFAIAWLIKEIPLRTTAHVGTTQSEPMAFDAPGEFPGL
jgi:hypothetical protein